MGRRDNDYVVSVIEFTKVVIYFIIIVINIYYRVNYKYNAVINNINRVIYYN
jgi:hypothetical protein